MIKAIVCVDEKWGIGKNNDLLFHLKKDMEEHPEEYNNALTGDNLLNLLTFLSILFFL